MKRRILLILLAAVTAIALSGCVTIKGEAGQSQEPVQTQDIPETTEQDTIPESSPLEEVSPTAEAQPQSEESCAYITAMSMRMDGQTDITFDFVDWLSGDEALEKYLEDHPDASEEEIEGEGIYEAGYIRNVDNTPRTFHTTPGTAYFLPDSMDMGVNIEVGYDEFRDRMFPAVDMGVDEYLTFVMVTVKGEEIISVEWLYTP